ncbi:MAG: hypothetical protein E7466_03700 [Ruminococcaceae bacterium]|nr:hypothetical protein [Oscillospiraceae bacterium]
MNRLDRTVLQMNKLRQWLNPWFGGDRLFFISYGTLLAASVLSTSFYYRYFDVRPFYAVQILCVGLLVVFEWMTGGVEKRHWPAFGFCLFFAVIGVMRAEGNLTRLVGLIFPYVFCARKIPFPKIADISLKVTFITVAFIVFSGYLGVIDNVVAHRSGRLREYLGFRYSLYAPGIVLNMTALYIYIRKSRITIPAAIFWALLNWYVYHMTDSRISFVLAELLIVIAVLMRFMPKIVEKVQALWAVMAASFAIFGVGSLLMTIFYDSTNPWMRRLNTALEGRLNLGRKSLSQYGIPLFGKDIEWIGNGLDVDGNTVEGIYNYVDCLYVKVLQRYGLVFTVLLIVLLCWAMFRLWRQKEYHILLISASVAAHCVLDDLSFSLHYNTFWIAMGVALLAPSMLRWDGRTNQFPPPEPPTQ